ncbi:MAG: DNA mismatch repair endonuclease MutL [Clostridia bacterium]|nr:DNA mismatch repair endonuclease MutL [Clostridia bacterium]
MSKINILTPEIFNKIAAGEVVERPASVIKELVENSIDSGASLITIEVVGGGIEAIVVTDNGSGIEKDDLQKAFLPHATSKIRTEEDLNSIFTLGFRGEALASISAVSNVTLQSRTKDSDIGAKISVRGGIIEGISDVGASTGTTITVKNLFFNVPARAKFLKKPKSEEQEITNLVSRFILANPTVSFRYIADGKTIYQSSGSGKDDALFCVYGKDALNQTLKLDREGDGIKISGVIGKPAFSKPNRTYQTIVINGRYINCYQISSAVYEAYGESLMKRQYPFFVLYLTIPNDCVDVNVHPNKMEVRFSDTSKVVASVYGAVTNALDKMDEITAVSDKEIQTEPQIKPEPQILSKEKFESFGFDKTDDIAVDDKISSVDNLSFASRNTQQGVADGFGLGSAFLDGILENNTKPNFSSPASETIIDKPNLVQADMNLDKSIRKIGKLFNTYLLLEDDQNVYFVDQHAAHERLNYEKFKAQVQAGTLVVQPLLIPYSLSVNAQEEDIINDRIKEIRELGFEIEPFGTRTFKISTVPSIVADLNFAEFFSNFLMDNKRISALKSVDLIKDELIQLSCKSAVKGGWDLSESEIEALYKSLGKEKVALYCPHGRPIVIRITKQEIEKWFKRIV